MVQAIIGLLKNPYFIALFSPCALLIVGALGKGTIKGDFGWRNWCLGFDAALTALFASSVYCYDIARDKGLMNTDKLLVTGGFSGMALIFFFVVVACHRMWEPRDGSGWKQFAVLALVANFVGFGLLIAFVLIVKGV